MQHGFTNFPQIFTRRQIDAMKKRTLFTGAATALVTPFRHGRIDYPALAKIIEAQINAGIRALIVCGTTGEPCSLSSKERTSLLEFALDCADKRAVMIAGTGTSDTVRTCRLTREAAKLGYDAALVVTPYYNKTSQRGLILHYSEVAKSADIPLIVYNVPARTGLNVEPGTYAELAKIENVTAVKEASESTDQLAGALISCGDVLDVYCGSDNRAALAMQLGARGVISVVSNLIPQTMVNLCELYVHGKYNEAAELFARIKPLAAAMFCDVSPVPVKYALSLTGICKDQIRLPLAPLDEAAKKQVHEAIAAFKPF